MRHLLISYHTCPNERPGQDLAGGMNVLLKGFLSHTSLETEVVTRSFAGYQRLELRPGIVVHRLPCGATRPWTREKAWKCLDAFKESFASWLQGRLFEVASAHYWMSGALLSLLDCPAAIIFHTLQIQKGPPSDALERYRAKLESCLAASYPSAYLHWPDLKDACTRLGKVYHASVVRPGIEEELLLSQPRKPGDPVSFGWAARNDAIKNFLKAKSLMARLRTTWPQARLTVAGMHQEPSPGFKYLGPILPQDMPSFYAGIDELWNFSGYETFGLSVLEALASGATVGLEQDCAWARRLRRIGIDSTPARGWSIQERMSALRLAQAYGWKRALPSWERWLSRVAKRSSS